MSIFAYFATATVVTITIGGGGTALGFLSKALISSTTNSQPQEANLGLSSWAQDSHSGLTSQADSNQSDRLQSEPEQVRVTQNLNGEGNCKVEGGWEEKVIAYLPKGFKYVAAYCTNTGGFESSLTNWRGFLPTGMFVDGAKSLKDGDKFYISVEGKVTEGTDDSFFSDVQAKFSSDKFVGSSVTGKWGNNFVDDIPDGVDSVYKVDLLGTGPTGVDKFYLQWF